MKFCSEKIIILMVILLGIYLLFIRNNIIGKSIEGFAVCDNESEYVGNPLIKRDASNLSFNPALTKDVDPRIAVLGFGDLSGWQGKKNDELIVRFNDVMNLKSLIIGGYGKFSIQVETINNSTKSRLWRDLKNSNGEVGKENVFEGGNKEVGFTKQETSKCFNLNVEGDSNILCQAIKFKVHEVNNVKAQFEVLGLELDANPAYKHNEYLNLNAKLYNENNIELPKTDNNVLTWTAEDNNNDPRFKIKFESTDSVPIANKLISYIEFMPNGNTWITSYNISFKYQGSDITRHITDVPGNSGPGTVSRFYFKYPLLANELTLKPSSSKSFGSSMNTATKPASKVKVFGKIIATESSEKILKAEQETYYKINQSKNVKSTCPPITSLINKQAEIQQLCEALEQSDEIEYEKKKIDTNKFYHLKLAKQRKEIKELQDKIKNMRDANKYFDDVEDRNKLALFKYQEEMDKKLHNLVKNRLDKQTGINFNLSVKDPNIQKVDKLNKEIKNTTDIIESFQGCGSDSSRKFLDRGLSLPPEEFYEEFVGSHYFN
jgi:hypothetical protein